MFLENLDKNKIALYEKDKSVTYKELIDRINQKKEKFTQENIHTVGIWASNSLEWAVFFVETFFNNTSIFVFPYKMLESDVNAYCQKYNIQVLLTDKTTIYYQKEDTESKINNKVVLFTSGSTGKPKGIVLSKSAIWGNACSISKYMELFPNDKMLIVKGLYHSSSLSGELLLGVKSGITIEIYAGTFFPSKVINTINRNCINIMGGTPSIFLSMIDNVNRCTLKKIMISGSFTSPRVLDVTSKYFMCEVYHVYGLTEAGPRVTYLPPKVMNSKAMSIGIPIENVQVKIVDENGIELSNGETGELFVKSDYLMEGYLDDQMLSNEKLTKEGLYTGDVGYKDKDGYLYLVGRIDDMICRSGENIWPNTIDNTMLKVKGVSESYTIGLSDEYLSQRIVTILKVVKGVCKSDIYTKCREDFVQRPDDIYILDDIPKLPNGKYDREKIKSMLREYCKL